MESIMKNKESGCTSHEDNGDNSAELLESQTKKTKVYWTDNFSDKNANVLTAFSVLVAIAYSTAFAGWDIHPQLSFFVFSIITLGCLFICLKNLGWLVNPKAFLWGLPIIVIAAFNAIFNLAIFHYFNAIVVFMLFAFITLGATRNEKSLYENLSYWQKILNLIFSDITAGFALQSRTMKTFKITKNSTVVRIVFGICLAIPIGGVIFILMLSGDQVFFALTMNLLENIEFNFVRFLWRIVVVFIAALYFMGFLHKAKYMETDFKEIKAGNIDQIISVSFLSVLNVLFVVFCYIQLAFLFTGGINTLPPGVVYAEYAREGFFQLLFITIINFSVLIFFVKYFGAINKIVRFMLLLLVIFTGILIASSFYRMNLYIDVFGYTPLRMMVVTFLAMESVFLLATAYALFKPNFNIIRFYLVVGLVFFVVANVTSTAFVSARLNTLWHFSESREYVFDEHSHFLTIDSARDLILIYESTDDQNMRRNILWSLEAMYNRHQNEPLQNWSLIKHINMTHLSQFLGEQSVRAIDQ